jgi:hypothetical protein
MSELVSQAIFHAHAILSAKLSISASVVAKLFQSPTTALPILSISSRGSWSMFDILAKLFAAASSVRLVETEMSVITLVNFSRSSIATQSCHQSSAIPATSLKVFPV